MLRSPSFCEKGRYIGDGYFQEKSSYEAEIILLCVRWYLRYGLSYRDLEEIMSARGLAIDHSTIYRWVQRYTPELEKRCRPISKPLPILGVSMRPT